MNKLVTVEHSLLAFQAGACIILAILIVYRVYAVRNSHQRYVATTTIVLTIAVLIVTYLSLAAFASMHGDYATFALRLFFTGFWAWLSTEFFDDDNWFKNQWTRIKDGIKKVRERMASAMPLPSSL